MLRLIHTQNVQGPLLVDDIDDGLPNKMTHRLGSTSDPKAYKRDGYANEPKQPCYVPFHKPGNLSIAGYIDLNETSRVKFSAAQNKIAGLTRAGKLMVVSFVESDLATPVITVGTLNTPGAGDVTLTGTGFLSLSPNISTVRFFGAGVGDVTLTRDQVLAGAGGVFSNTSIVVDTLLIPGVAAGDHVTVTADDHLSNSFLL